ncbi:MAG: class I SAM-dependent methyltransferase [bacterium]
MAPEPAPKSDEIIELLHAVRDRVRARHEGLSVAGVPLPNLMPAVHARDAALAKVASIGSVNPRPPGLLNSAVQAVKRLIARALDWHVREQVEFNRGVMTALQAIIEALDEGNRALGAAVARSAAAHEAASRALDESQAARSAAEAARAEASAAARTSADIATHWSQWRAGWEHKLAHVEIDFLRNVSELHAAFDKRVAQLEDGIRGQVTLQHRDFTLALNRAVRELRRNFEQLVHAEIRVLRQRLAIAEAAGVAAAIPAAPLAPAPLSPDDFAHQECFRGPEEEIRERQRYYVPFFAKCRNVVDLGCGRGEFLELMREAGVPARGVDSNPEVVALCRAKGLDAEAGDLFAFLAALPDESLDGVFSAQVVEHLPPERVPELIRLIAAKLARGGTVAIETPNPECLAIFASHYYLDPTHRNPVPARLLAFYLHEAGMGDISIEPLSPAIDTMPALADLPPAFRDAFFGGLDYAITAHKL